MFVSVGSEGFCGATAVMVTWPLLFVGTTAGAVYSPTCGSEVEATMVPNVELPPPIPFTCQVTAVFVVLVELDSVTTAVMSMVVLIWALAAAGEMVTPVTRAEPPPPLPPPHPGKLKIAASATTENAQREILAARFSTGFMRTLIIPSPRVRGIALFPNHDEKFRIIFPVRCIGASDGCAGLEFPQGQRDGTAGGSNRRRNTPNQTHEQRE